MDTPSALTNHELAMRVYASPTPELEHEAALRFQKNELVDEVQLKCYEERIEELEDELDKASATIIALQARDALLKHVEQEIGKLRELSEELGKAICPT
jgi:hypothetical protein